MKEKHGKKRTLSVAILLLCAMLLSACGSDAYTEYSAAYNKLSANGGIDANIRATLVMDGTTQNYAGNFKVDNTHDLLYYEMNAMDGSTVQFSDGSYLYTIQEDQKVKYSLKSGEPSENSAPEADPEEENGEAPEFDTGSFLSDFASMLEANKIRELGLLSPIDKAAVVKTSKEGNTYTLEVSNAIVQKFLNTLAADQAGTSDTVQVSDLKNFKYTATVSNGVITGNAYSGDVTVKVPASLMSSGTAAEYQLSFSINVDFVNPGQTVTVTIPSTEGFEEINGL